MYAHAWDTLKLRQGRDRGSYDPTVVMATPPGAGEFHEYSHRARHVCAVHPEVRPGAGRSLQAAASCAIVLLFRRKNAANGI